MKYVFNVLLAFVVIWVIWSVIDHNPQKENVNASAVESEEWFDGVRLVKICRNTFRRPISVEFCNDEIFVSNEVEDPGDGGSLGYVCRMGLYGDIVDSLKIPALYAPKGMAEQDGYLYIADISRVVKYDLNRDALESVIVVPNAQTLFDVTKDRMGRLFVSDTQSESIYVLDGDTAQVFVTDTLLDGLSGLCCYNGNLYAAANRRIVRIDSVGRAKIFAYTAYPVCGICSDEEGNFITTDFAGNIYVVSKGKQELLRAKKQDASGADIGYIPEQRCLVVPTYNGNSVEIYDIGKYLKK